MADGKRRALAHGTIARKTTAALAGSERVTGGAGRRDIILTMLRASPEPMTVTDIADKLGVHVNTVRFHLDALVEAQRVDRTLGDPAGPGRPPLVYAARREMDRGGPRNYRLLAEILTTNFAATAKDPIRAATELGRSWGGYLIEPPPPPGITSKKLALAQLINLLADLNFEPGPLPARGRRSEQVRLHHCPFLELVDTHADVICSLHLGMMQGAMKALDAPVRVDSLQAFVEPDVCVAYLSTSDSADTQRIEGEVRSPRRGR